MDSLTPDTGSEAIQHIGDVFNFDHWGEYSYGGFEGTLSVTTLPKPSK